MFVCGACQGPKDIPESVAQATAAAGKVLVMFSHEQLAREPEIAKVNETNCAACFACVRACPYDAIERAEIRDRKGQLVKRTARVNPGPVHGLRHLRGRVPLEERRPGRLHRTANLRHGGEPGMSEPNDFEPKIIAYVCNWCTYLGADLAGTNRLEYPANVRIIRLPCTGRIDFNLIVKAFEMGADAVLVSGCHPGDCHYTAGNYHARRRWILFRQLLETLGIDTGRVHFTWISAAEGKKWQQVITEITEKTRELGPYRGLPRNLPGNGLKTMLDELRQTCRRLLADGSVQVVIGYGQATADDRVVPVFITRPEDVDQLVWNDRCFANLTKYLLRKEVAALGKAGHLRQRLRRAGPGRAGEGIADRPLADRRDRLGLRRRGQPQPKCEACDVHVPRRADVVIGQAADEPPLGGRATLRGHRGLSAQNARRADGLLDGTS